MGRTAVDARAWCTHCAIWARWPRRPANGPSVSGSWPNDCSRTARARAAALRSPPRRALVAAARSGTGGGTGAGGAGEAGAGAGPRVGGGAVARGGSGAAVRCLAIDGAPAPDAEPCVEPCAELCAEPDAEPGAAGRASSTNGLIPRCSTAASHADLACAAPAGSAWCARRVRSAATQKVAAPVARPVITAAPADSPCPRSRPKATTAATIAASPGTEPGAIAETLEAARPSRSALR